MQEPEYEYGIEHLRWPLSAGHSPHRENYTQEQAEKWHAEWVAMGGKPEVMRIIRRPVAAWEPVD